jgi:hypothetical protein
VALPCVRRSCCSLLTKASVPTSFIRMEGAGHGFEGAAPADLERASAGTDAVVRAASWERREVEPSRAQFDHQRHQRRRSAYKSHFELCRNCVRCPRNSPPNTEVYRFTSRRMLWREVVDATTRRGVSVSLGERRPNCFPSVLLQPLGHLSDKTGNFAGAAEHWRPRDSAQFYPGTRDILDTAPIHRSPMNLLPGRPRPRD